MPLLMPLTGVEMPFPKRELIFSSERKRESSTSPPDEAVVAAAGIKPGQRATAKDQDKSFASAAGKQYFM